MLVSMTPAAPFAAASLCVAGNLNRDFRIAPVAPGGYLFQDGETSVPFIRETTGGGGADAGYFSEAAVTDPKVKGIELLVPPERQKQGVGSETSPMILGVEPPAAAAPKSQQVGESAEQPVAKSAAETMREKLHTTAGQAVYKMRKAVVEPVFGQIKERRGLRGFLMRGREKAAAEWQIICLTHNLLKLFQARTAPANHPK